MSWKVTLYFITVLLATVSMILGIYDSSKHIHVKPTVERVVMKWLLAIAFAMKAPYFTDKPMALVAVVVLSGGYFIMAVLDSIRRATAKGSECA